jgi:transcriptional regulator with XRE-family HTH domain
MGQMATLKIPGLSKRIKELVEAAIADMPPQPRPSQGLWATKHGIPQPQVSAWVHGKTPAFEGLQALAYALGRPWELLLIGEEGYALIEQWKRDGRLPDPQPPPPLPGPLVAPQLEAQRGSDTGRPARRKRKKA